MYFVEPAFFFDVMTMKSVGVSAHMCISGPDHMGTYLYGPTVCVPSGLAHLLHNLVTAYTDKRVMINAE